MKFKLPFNNWGRGYSTSTAPTSGFKPKDKKGASFNPVDGSIIERVEQWYLKPFERLNSPNDGFAILTLLFPLYERYLKWKGYIGEEDFTKGHKVFKAVGKHLSVDPDDSFIFWNRYRNGLLHHAAPKAYTDTTFAIVRIGDFCIKREGNHLWVNPFKIRDVVLSLVQDSRDMWKDPDYPIPSEFVEYPK